MRRWQSIASHTFWYGIPAVVAALVLGYIGLALDWHVRTPTFPVLGTSMQPLLHAGDLVFVRGVDPATLKTGDIIAFHPPNAAQSKYNLPSLYTHRIIKIAGSAKDGNLSFRTKGDNVGGPDPFWVLQKDVVGEYVGHVRYLGFPVLFVRSKQGEIFAGAAAGIALIYFLMGLWDKRQLEEEGHQLTLRSIVDEARTLAERMESTTAPPQPVTVMPPPAPPEALERLEEEIHEALSVNTGVQETMRELVGAIGEYGEHLRSHTAVMQGLAATTIELQRATQGLRQTITVPGTAQPAAPPPPASAVDPELLVMRSALQMRTLQVDTMLAELDRSLAGARWTRRASSLDS